MNEIARAANGVAEDCGACRYFRRSVMGRAMGVCRANPPVVVLLGMTQHPVTGRQQPVTDTFFPHLPDTEWCGAFARRAAGKYAEIDLSALKAEAEA